MQNNKYITVEIDHEKEKEIESIIKNVIPTISDKDFFITRIKNDSYCLLTFFTRISMEDISGILFETKLKLISIDCDGYLWPNDAGKWRPAFILKCKLHSF